MIRAARCPWCHDAVVRGEPLAVCNECHAFHHEACFREAAGCAACSREAALAGPLQLSRWRRYGGALGVAAGFLVGQFLGFSVTLVTRTSDAPVEVPPRQCPRCCPRHHHDCH